MLQPFSNNYHLCYYQLPKTILGGLGEIIVFTMGDILYYESFIILLIPTKFTLIFRVSAVMLEVSLFSTTKMFRLPSFHWFLSFTRFLFSGALLLLFGECCFDIGKLSMSLQLRCINVLDKPHQFFYSGPNSFNNSEVYCIIFFPYLVDFIPSDGYISIFQS